MKLKYLGLAILLAVFLACASMAYAQQSLASGYRVTTDHHGVDVWYGETVVAWADTVNMTVEYVEFEWKWESGGQIEETYTSWTYDTWFTVGEPGLPDGTEVHRFSHSYEPDKLGDWRVKATFFNAYGQTPANQNDSFPVRATSFETIPEVPIGTIAVVLTMFGSLGLFALRKKRISLPKMI